MNTVDPGESGNKFGALLKQYRQRAIDPQEGGYLTQARFIELAKLPISEQTLGHWENGRRSIKQTDRFILTTIVGALFKYGGIITLDEANEFLETGLYSQLTQEEIEEINPEWLAERAKDLQPQPDPQSSLTIILSLSTIYDWFDSLFRWSEANTHARTSLAGMFIWSLSSVSNRVTASGVFYFLCALILWIFSTLLILPILQWPLDDPSIRLRASIMFAVVTVVTPIAVALLSHTDVPQDYFEKNTQQKGTMIFLKLTGAAVGFNMVSATLLLVAIGFFYIGWSPNPWVWRILLLLPLFVAYVGAQRIPADRYKMYNGSLRMHSADPLFLVTFLLISPGLGFFVYLWTDYLSNKAMGLGVIIASAGIALWHRQKHSPIPDALLIFIVGTLSPSLILSLFLFVFPSKEIEEAVRGTTFPERVLILVYVMSAITLWATVQLRNPPRITLRGALGLLFVLLFLLGLLSFDLFLGRIATILIIGLWLVWGKKRFRSHLWIHASVAFLIFLLGSSLFLLFQGILTIWTSLVGYTFVSTALILWTYWSGKSSYSLTTAD